MDDDEKRSILVDAKNTIEALTARAESAEKALAEVTRERDSAQRRADTLAEGWKISDDARIESEARIATIERETLERAAVAAEGWYRNLGHGTPHEEIRAMIEEKTDE